MSNELEIKVPNVGESISQVTIAKWLIKDGDYVERDQVLAELESDKATFELNAENAGVITILVKAEEDAEVGAIIGKIDTDAKAPEKLAQKPTSKKEIEKVEAEPTNTKIDSKNAPINESSSYASGTPSPSASKMIQENALSNTQIQGTGKEGRITKEDVMKALKSGRVIGSSNQVVLENKSRAVKKEKMSNLRKTIARRLVAAKNETAMLTTFNEVDMTEILKTRNLYKEKFKEKYNFNLGFMSFFTRACTLSLEKFPRVNGIIEDDYVIQHDYSDVGIAVSTDKGLVVPIIRNAESMSLFEIEAKIGELAKKAREGKLTLEEMTGGTFTISNGGVFGSLMSTPILNQPQSAILGMHKTQERPIALNGQVVIRPMMYLALSYDHRIIDGKESVSFLVNIKNLLENPALLLYGEDPVKLLLGL